MLKQKYFLTGIFILSAERQPIKLAWRKIVWLQKMTLLKKRISKQSGKALITSLFEKNRKAPAFTSTKISFIII